MVGEVIAIDPGHDGGNVGRPASSTSPSSRGNFTESCDTVGPRPAVGYAEHAFNFDVGSRLESLLGMKGRR